MFIESLWAKNGFLGLKERLEELFKTVEKRFA
jgi:hypothetical protein